MRAVLWAGSVLLLLQAGICLAATHIIVEGAKGDFPEDIRQVIIFFRPEIPGDLDAQVTSTTNYVVTEDVNPNGSVEPAVRTRVVKITRAFFRKRSTGGIDRSAVVLELASVGFGRGMVTVRTMTAGQDTVEGSAVPWALDRISDLSATSGSFNLKFPSGTLVADFNYSYISNFSCNRDCSQASRRWLSLEGSVPITTPFDVQGVPGANDDASRLVVGFVQGSFMQRAYHRAGYFTAYGLTVRTSGRFNGLEAVARYQLAAFPSNDRSFFAAEGEAGYRDGRSEWINLTQRAPFRGNLVARLGAVVEWAPQLGPINRDLGSGLRFFVRGRGWADYAKDDSGHDGVRFRGFLDSEFFYNISTEYRVFLRYELGSLPPDLTRSVSTVMVGIGASF
jgi:hypothetical protein